METSMTISEDGSVMTRIIQVRVPGRLANAMEQAAQRRFSSLSDVVRESLATSMRAAGLLEEA
jgi:Arc/MetJ-type ribon-helix-helix transcriptional regulator